MADLREAFAGDAVSVNKQLAGTMSGLALGSRFNVFKNADNIYFTEIFKVAYPLTIVRSDNGKYVYIKTLKGWNGLYRILLTK